MDGVEIDQWLDMVEDLLVQCETSSADPARLLTGMHWLMQTGPAYLCEPVRPDISRSALQGLIDCGALESAALSLVGRCTYMLSRGEEGLVIATVLAPHSQRDHSFSAYSEAAALAGALATCLQDIVIAAAR